MTSPSTPVLFPEERRLATVLFADIQGFTSLAERLDFEVVSDLIKGVWLQIDTVLEEHGGYIDKHIGDAVMAVWGAPYAAENDVEQAVLAGLEIQRTLQTFISDTDLPFAEEIKLRVGINTGMVLAGYVGKRREYTVMGDTVNVASRLQQIAEIGTVVISEATYRLVHGAFNVRRIGEPFHLRGKAELVQGYLVEGVAEQPGRMRYRSMGSLETHMVGRDAEMARLQHMYEEIVDHENPELALVSGDVGMGKSRLLWEFSNWVEACDRPAKVLSARALAQITQVPFFLWKSLWTLRFGLQDSDTPDSQRQKLLRELQKIWGAQLGPASSVEVAHLLGSLMGIPFPDSTFTKQYEADPAGRMARTIELTRELLRRLCSFSPLVLVFDDLQYADPSSLAIISGLFESERSVGSSLRSAELGVHDFGIAPLPFSAPEASKVMHHMPLMILAGARLEFTKQQPRWLNLANLIHLEPLPVNPETVAAAYPSMRPLSQEILWLVAELADGNPYFMEELAKSLFRTGMMNERQSPEVLLGRLRENTPESLRGMLQARLDGLSHEARAVALLASVVGRVFWVGAVLSASRVMDPEGEPLLSGVSTAVVDRLVQDSLRQLARAELAFPRANSSYTEDQEYIFKHSMLREVAYSLIPRRLRPRYHLAVAQWLNAHRNLDMRAMAGSHFEYAGVYEEAARCYEASAELAILRGAPQEAANMLAHARELRSLHHMNGGVDAVHPDEQEP